MRKIQMEPGAIPAKYQQLAMLSVSAYAKCKYCMFFHTEVAKALGATREEITEAALLAGHTAHWSSFINGIQYDYDQFQREVRKACETLVANAGRTGAATTQRTTAAHH
jgi:AhpD family alkylhydroperoxidase